MTKISIARRRLETDGREATEAEKRSHHRGRSLNLVPDPEEARSHRPSSNQESSSDSLPKADPTNEPSQEWRVSVPAEQVSRLETMAEMAHSKDHEIAVGLEKKKESLVLNFQIQPAKHLLTAEEVADMLAMSRNYVYRLAKKNRLPSYKIGRALRFDAEDILDFLAQHSQ